MRYRYGHVLRRSWTSARLAGLAAAAFALVAGLTTVPAGASAAATDGGTAFVTQQGGQLTLGGQPFRFSGTNIYWLGMDENGRASSHNYPTSYRVNDALATAAYMGGTVVRAQSLGMSVGSPLSVEPSLGVFNETALEHIDYAVAMAHRDGLRLIIPLVDAPVECYYLGCGKTFSDWLGVPAGDFYSNPKVIAAFEQYVTHLLDHVNVYTGVALKDDPTVMAWETCNECHTTEPGEAAWTPQIAAFLKHLDSHHLVMDGTYGINPADLHDPNLDLYSDHYYPMSVSRLTADASLVAAAGKQMVAGEYGWDMSGYPPGDGFCTNCGDTLPSFLQALEQTPGLAGDTYWSLFGHNDAFGNVQHGDGFTLHYPGDTPAMRTAAAQLRAHAYAMRGLPVPPYPLPGTPAITSVERVTGGNLLEWRGAVGGAEYVVQRSTLSRVGPWTTLTTTATDNDTPWLDVSGPAGPRVWYRVRAVNSAGAAGLWSSVSQLLLATVYDPLNDWSQTYSHSADLTLDSSSPELFGGDTSRSARGSLAADQITWRVPDTRTFELVSYFLPTAVGRTNLTFLVSADGTHWRPIADQMSLDQQNQAQGQPPTNNWARLTYAVQGLHDVSYVRVAWTSVSGQASSPQIGEVRITHDSA